MNRLTLARQNVDAHVEAPRPGTLTPAPEGKKGLVRIPMKPATDSDLKPASHSDFNPATIPI
ncbi:hypothetical protein [Mesorhizobium sp. 113-1-2]|uniref:hypothetical protein n=1 Tax=Mesorhizobium sp. 113-1-2 TaxID=2744515 RepID=UPI0019286EEB|nr:hypothetical protein [Mesorhizobium sp. 113-1-2]